MLTWMASIVLSGSKISWQTTKRAVCLLLTKIRKDTLRRRDFPAVFLFIEVN